MPICLAFFHCVSAFMDEKYLPGKLSFFGVGRNYSLTDFSACTVHVHALYSDNPHLNMSTGIEIKALIVLW